MAFRLKLSVKTVETHRRQVMERLQIFDVPGLVRLASGTASYGSSPRAVARSPPQELAHCGPTGAAPIMLGVEQNDIARLSTALRAVGNELDALSQRVHALAAGRGDDAAMRCAGDCPHAAQYRDALRDAVAASNGPDLLQEQGARRPAPFARVPPVHAPR